MWDRDHSRELYLTNYLSCTSHGVAGNHCPSKKIKVKKKTKKKDGYNRNEMDKEKGSEKQLYGLNICGLMSSEK